MGEDEGNTGKFSIQRVLIKPLKSLAVNKDQKLSNRLPILPQEAKAYTPMPYVFRVPFTSIPSKVVNLLARIPPFHLLLDNTIAVVWLLFAKSNYDCPLGINQLQWALAFLKTIQSRNGDYPEDIQICINAIEDLLISGYAELQDEIKTASDLDQTIHYREGALGSSTLITEDIPFSLNYSEMLVRNAEESLAMLGISMTSVQCEEELEKLKQAAGVKSIENLDSKSKDKAINVLRMWKTDQVEKIRGELKRLRSIEDKMKYIDHHFAGYSEDDPDELLNYH